MTTPAPDTMKNAGTSISPILFTGIKTGTTNNPPLYSDWTTKGDTANFPHFNFGTKPYKTSACNKFKHICFYGDSIRGVSFGTASPANNNLTDCILINTAASPSTNYLAFAYTFTHFTHCIFRSAYSKGIYSSGSTFFEDCLWDHFNDATNGKGITFAGGNIFIFQCFFVKNTNLAIDLSNNVGVIIINNLFDSCGVDVNATTASSVKCENNIHRYTVTNCYKWTTQTDGNEFFNNHIGLNNKHIAWNLVDTTNSYQDYGQTSGDPLVTTPGINYTLKPGSPCINAGYGPKFGAQ
jgi:hypothetical protein